MTHVSENCNCIVCAKEFSPGELESIVSSTINVTRFKICQSCLDQCDPADDYRQALNIVGSYLDIAEAKHLFAEVKDILNSIKK